MIPRARKAAILLPICLLACSPSQAPRLSAVDRASIDSLKQAYVSAWLRDDTLGVLATFTPDALLLPPGKMPVAGRDAIRAYWWPQDGSHTTITAFSLTVDEVDGSGSIAYARGLSTLAWKYSTNGATQEQTGRNQSLTIYHRDDAGRWKIARQMWGPSINP